MDNVINSLKSRFAPPLHDQIDIAIPQPPEPEPIVNISDKKTRRTWNALKACMDKIDQSLNKDPDRVGIFRQSASNKMVKKLAKDLRCSRKRKKIVKKHDDIFLYAEVLKKILRDKPAIPRKDYEAFIVHGQAVESTDETLNKLKNSIQKLPEGNLSILRATMWFFKRIAMYEETTKMGIDNLSIVLAPTLLQSRDNLIMLNDVEAARKISSLMITHYDELFHAS